jgi:hypothetical protein
MMFVSNLNKRFVIINDFINCIFLILNSLQPHLNNTYLLDNSYMKIIKEALAGQKRYEGRKFFNLDIYNKVKCTI